MERVLSKKEAAARKAVSPSTWDRQEAEAKRSGDPTFPARRVLGSGRVGYLESEVDAHLRALPVGTLSSRTEAARLGRAAARAARDGAGEAA